MKTQSKVKELILNKDWFEQLKSIHPESIIVFDAL